MWSTDGSCFPLCNLFNNSMTSNDVDRKKKKSENVSGRGTPSSIEIHSYLNLNLNLNSLLVKRQIDNPSPGAVTGGN